MNSLKSEKFAVLMIFFFVTIICVISIEVASKYIEYKMKNTINSNARRDEKNADNNFKKQNSDLEYEVDIDTIIERNLFKNILLKDKEFVKKTSDNTNSNMASKIDIVLIGTIVGNNDESNRACILNLTTGKQEILKKGMGIMGAVIRDIGRESIIVSIDGIEHKLTISEGSKFRNLSKTNIESGKNITKEYISLIEYNKKAVNNKNLIQDMNYSKGSQEIENRYPLRRILPNK